MSISGEMLYLLHFPRILRILMINVYITPDSLIAGEVVELTGQDTFACFLFRCSAVLASKMDKDEELQKPQITHEEALAFAQLTDDEKRIERKLRILLDTLILPLIVIIYLMVGLPWFLRCDFACFMILADGVCVELY